MKAQILKSFRTSALLPVLSLVMAMTLVTGQVLKCCRLNEALTVTAAQAFHALTFLGGNHPHEDGHAERAAHPRCHSHASASGSLMAPGNVPKEGPVWLPEDPCLSDDAFAPKALPPSAPDFSSFLVAFLSPRLDPEVLPPVHIAKPRPQNKSSPPVYLLTLRLLV